MGNFTYLRDDQNLAITAILESSSADTSYPLSNVQNLPVSQPFRTTGKASENIRLDLSTAQAVDCLALINTNLSSTATITLNGGSVTNPDGSEFTTTITRRQYDSFKVFSSQTFRYWKVILVDTDNTDAFLQVGYLIIGDSTTLGFNFAPGWEQVDEYENLELESEMGAPHVYELFNRVRLTMIFNNLSDADMATLRALYRQLKRNLTGLLIIPDSVGTEAYFGRIVSLFNQSIDFYRTVSLEFLEDSRGKTLGA